MPNTTLFSLLALQLHPIFHPVHLRELIQIKSLGFIPRKDYLSWMHCLFDLQFFKSFSKAVKVYFKDNARKQSTSRLRNYSNNYS